MVLIATLTSVGLAALLSLLGWTLNRVVTGFDARFDSFDNALKEVRGDIKDLRADMETQNKELRVDMEAQNKELRADMGNLRADMEAQNKELRADMETQNKELRADISSLREDHSRIEGKMDGLLAARTD